jgi:hypothetical protein
LSHLSDERPALMRAQFGQPVHQHTNTETHTKKAKHLNNIAKDTSVIGNA